MIDRAYRFRLDVEFSAIDDVEGRKRARALLALLEPFVVNREGVEADWELHELKPAEPPRPVKL